MTARIYHRWDKWECFKAGLYDNYARNFASASEGDLLNMYADFLNDDLIFTRGMKKVSDFWIHSCEHFLTNESMNRVAWLGQAAMCIETSVPRKYRSGFYLLSNEDQLKANSNAKKFLSEWIDEHEKNISLHKDMGTSRLF